MKQAIRSRLCAFSLNAQRLANFWRDRSGTGAIEFAIVAPLLIVAYLGSFEMSVGFNTARKVSRASSTVADVLTQMQTVDKKTLDGMKDVAASVMSPFGMTNYTLKMTGIKVTGPGKGIVAWSRDEDGATPYKIGTVISIPNDIKSVNAFLVRSELVVPHELLLFAPGLAGSDIKTINLSKTYYFRQRVGTEIKCTDCT
ncbi:TadE/TadG family type IV pilus assembly protein [Pararhizobium gei]|uniref:TadE/TadG family type IV pilus assembly protein n=1 Tax=Pararhizobium gei TaxID=1395951 RepID=UPI0023DAF6D1|nr:TadE/TadG family type IV pilus assembly protein [Rhizobium gei]